MEGTRVGVLRELEEWAFNDTASMVCWMCGIAGTGKSTIAHSFCELLEERGMLGASYFCSLSLAEASNAENILPTIATRMAQASPPILSSLLQLLQDNPDRARSKRPEVQLKSLISQPIANSVVGCTGRCYKVIVIDALDECINQLVVTSLIKTLLASTSSLPIKIFISSRDEPHIRAAFDAVAFQGIFHLHEIEKSIVQDDIQTYLSKSLEQISNIEKDWKTSPEVLIIATRADKLFIYAATVIRMLNTQESHYQDRLQDIIDNSSCEPLDAGSLTHQLDSLYNQIMARVFDKGIMHNEATTRRNVLQTIIFLQNPFTCQCTRKLIGPE